jgi:hypothetical protein
MLRAPPFRNSGEATDPAMGSADLHLPLSADIAATRVGKDPF